MSPTFQDLRGYPRPGRGSFLSLVGCTPPLCAPYILRQPEIPGGQRTPSGESIPEISPLQVPGTLQVIALGGKVRGSFYGNSAFLKFTQYLSSINLGVRCSSVALTTHQGVSRSSYAGRCLIWLPFLPLYIDRACACVCVWHIGGVCGVTLLVMLKWLL